MRLAIGTAGPDDIRARVDDELPSGEIVRDGSELRVGAPDGWGLDALRAAAAFAARSLRRTGGRIAWEAAGADDVRAVVEGTAYGAYDAGLRKAGHLERPELTLVLDVDGDLRRLAERQEV